MSGVNSHKFHNNFPTFCSSAGLKEHLTASPPLGSVFKPQQDFWPIMSHFREHVLLAVVHCASLQQVTLLRADWLLKQVRCLTLQNWRPVYTTATFNATFCLVVNLWCKLDLKRERQQAK